MTTIDQLWPVMTTIDRRPSQYSTDQSISYPDPYHVFYVIAHVIFYIFQDLNTYLTDKVFFLNHRLSLIDLVLYYTLHATFVSV
jgi:hypothetical protein